EPALRRTLADLAPHIGFEYTVAVLPISVVALATTTWIARHLALPPKWDRLVLPGLCLGELDVFSQATSGVAERGPKDLRDLPEYFGRIQARPANYGKFDIEIIAEINFAPRLTSEDLLTQSLTLSEQGADIIDLGCDPGLTWDRVGEAVRMLR